jgi:hypothetical protein
VREPKYIFRVDARAFQALDDAVHAALSHELDELARLAGLVEELRARASRGWRRSAGGSRSSRRS